MSYTTPIISIILPAFNEGFRIIESINQIIAKLNQLHYSYEIIIVNDGSTDNTLNQTKTLTASNITVIHLPTNRGKGYAVRTGMRLAQGDYHLFMDVDLSTSLDAITIFLNLLKESHVDIVIGDRKTHRYNQIIRQPFSRQFLGYGFTKLSQWLLSIPTKDFTCGFKMFTRQASQTIFQKQYIDNWAFDSEILFIAHKHHFHIIEEPVQWQHAEKSKVRLSKDIIASLIGLYQILINDCKGRYQ